MKLHEIIAKHRMGDHLTDDEIQFGINSLQLVLDVIGSIPEYKLMKTDMIGIHMHWQMSKKARSIKSTAVHKRYVKPYSND